MRRLSPSAVTVRPGAYFWTNHLVTGLIVVGLAQLPVLTLRGTPAAQVVAALVVACAFLISGARTQLRILDGVVVIRNPWYTRRVPVADLDRITPQRVLDKPRSCNCLAFRVRGAPQGWPAIATMRSPRDGPFDVWRWQMIGDVTGVPVEVGPVNPLWRPGAFRRRQPS